VKDLLRAAALASLLLLACAGAWNHALWIYDEPREAELAREMWRSGTWTHTVLNEQPFLEKPPLFTASVAASFALLGRPSVLAARLVAASWSLLTLAIVFWFARRTIHESMGLVAALVLATTNRFFTCQHTILLDNALCAFTTGALAFGWVAATEKRRGLALLMGACLAGAFLTKGLVGVGIVGLVLGIEVACARDRLAALRTLLHPAVFLLAAAPVALYAWVLDRAGGPGFVHELFWNNQFGRFFHGYNSVRTSWHLYLRTWHEMIGVWTPLALLALLRPLLILFGIARPPLAAVNRFLIIWAVVPLAVLTLSAARARFYAVPVTPAYALLVTAVWNDLALTPAVRTVLGWLSWAGGVAVIATAVAFAILGRLDVLAVLAGVMGATAIAGLVVRRDPGASREALALSFLPAVVGGYLLFSSSFVAHEREPRLTYKDVSDEVWPRVGSRQLLIFHANDSYSGTFAFYADRSTPGFDEIQDPQGEKLLAAITSNDVVLAPRGAINAIPEERRRLLAVDWENREKDEKKDFILYRRRAIPRE